MFHFSDFVFALDIGRNVFTTNKMKPIGVFICGVISDKPCFTAHSLIPTLIYNIYTNLLS